MKWKLFSVIIGLCLLQFSAKAQELNGNLLSPSGKKSSSVYETDFLTADFHKNRRKAFRDLMPAKSVALFFSAPEKNRSNDVYYEYHQDPNMYYLSGIIEPNSALIIFKEAIAIQGKKVKEIAFVQAKNANSEIWNGKRMGLENAKIKLGIDWVSLNDSAFKFILDEYNIDSILVNEPYQMEEKTSESTGNLEGLYQHLTNRSKVKKVENKKVLEDIMAELRQDKQAEELLLMKKAIDITCMAQNRLMKEINPSMTEYQTEALIEYVFKSNGAEYPGFPSIQGSGENSCVLHYVSNRRPLSSGGLLVSDVGAEYHGYTADVTRTIPPSGKFSKEEKIIYELVLAAQDAGIEQAKKGNNFWAPHMAASKVISQGLIKLGLIKDAGEMRNYFMHGTSHYLGLDVHDAGKYGKLAVNQVITVEPGIYIKEGSDCDQRWWNIGVRIEDDILITENGPVNLSGSSPRTVEEIEKMMDRKNQQ